MRRTGFVLRRAIASVLSIFRVRYLILGLLAALLVVTPVFSQNLRLDEAETFYRNGNFPEAILRLEEAARIFQQAGDTRKEAIARTNLGNAQLALGQAEKAQENLERAVELYARLGDTEGVKRGRIYQSRAMQELGLFLRACEMLAPSLGLNADICQEEEFEFPSPFRVNEIEREGWWSLGELFRVIGKIEESQKILERLIEIYPNDAAILLSLGNTLRAKGNLERDRAALPQYDYQPWLCGQSDPFQSGMNAVAAISFYKQALESYQMATTSTDREIKTQAQLNRLSLLLEMAQKEENRAKDARSLLSQIDLSPLPPSRQKVYAEIDLAESRACLLQLEQNSVRDNQNHLIRAMREAIVEAQRLQDERAESYGLGELGGLYEYLGNFARSRQLTEQALYLAQPQDKPDIAYQWQWQLGRLLAKQNDREEALRAYQSAVQTLKTVREDLLSLKTDLQYSFRDRVEPLYRQYLDLLLQPEASNEDLETAAEMVEQLQLAELENFLRCRITNFVPIDKVKNPPAAIIYPVLLKDRLEIIVGLPQPREQSSQFYRQTSVTQKDLNIFKNTLSNLKIELGKSQDIDLFNEQVKPLTQKLYQRLITPIEQYLPTPNSGTLLFVLDSDLRSIPMSVLNDGERYLIQKYSIAIGLGGQLPNPQPLELRQWQVSIAGIYKNAPSFQQNNSESLEKLPRVRNEIENIKALIPNSLSLTNEEFTKEKLTQQIDTAPLPVVHIATHARFSSDPEQTVIYAWDNPIKVDAFGQLLRYRDRAFAEPLNLLVLSACQTATGERRAPLGIAGVAVRANAGSTVASLWKVSDWATADFMEQFYSTLNQPNTTKAEALQQAQIAFIQQSETPYYWAAFILVGNWQ